MHHFDGKYGMLYVRIRHADDDFHRAARQRGIAALERDVEEPAQPVPYFLIAAMAASLTFG